MADFECVRPVRAGLVPVGVGADRRAHGQLAHPHLRALHLGAEDLGERAQGGRAHRGMAVAGPGLLRGGPAENQVARRSVGGRQHRQQVPRGDEVRTQLGVELLGQALRRVIKQAASAERRVHDRDDGPRWAAQMTDGVREAGGVGFRLDRAGQRQDRLAGRGTLSQRGPIEGACRHRDDRSTAADQGLDHVAADLATGTEHEHRPGDCPTHGKVWIGIRANAKACTSVHGTHPSRGMRNGRRTVARAGAVRWAAWTARPGRARATAAGTRSRAADSDPTSQRPSRSAPKPPPGVAMASPARPARTRPALTAMADREQECCVRMGGALQSRDASLGR